MDTRQISHDAIWYRIVELEGGKRVECDIRNMNSSFALFSKNILISLKNSVPRTIFY